MLSMCRNTVWWVCVLCQASGYIDRKKSCVQLEYLGRKIRQSVSTFFELYNLQLLHFATRSLFVSSLPPIVYKNFKFPSCTTGKVVSRVEGTPLCRGPCVLAICQSYWTLCQQLSNTVWTPFQMFTVQHLQANDKDHLVYSLYLWA